MKTLHNMIEMEDEGTDMKFKSVFEQIQHGKLKRGERNLLSFFCYIARDRELMKKLLERMYSIRTLKGIY